MVVFPGGSDGKASVYNVGDLVSSLGQEEPLEKDAAESVLFNRLCGKWSSADQAADRFLTSG